MKKAATALLILATFNYIYGANYKYMTNIQEEIWKDIADYEGLYQVSNLGRVKSLPWAQKHQTGTYFTKRTRFIKISIGTGFNGYSCVALTKNSIQKGYFMHRVIAKAFIPNPENKPMINHINGVKTDNRIENLEWVTRSENTIHAFATGLNKPKFGVDNFNTKLSEEQVHEIRLRYSLGESTYKIFNSDDYKISYTNVKDIVARRIWKHI